MGLATFTGVFFKVYFSCTIFEVFHHAASILTLVRLFLALQASRFLWVAFYSFRRGSAPGRRLGTNGNPERDDHAESRVLRIFSLFNEALEKSIDNRLIMAFCAQFRAQAS